MYKLENPVKSDHNIRKKHITVRKLETRTVTCL